MNASLSRLFRKIGVELMESEELTSKILLESVLECTDFVVNEVPNLYSAVIERLKQDDEVFFMNFVEDEDGQDDIMDISIIKQIEKSTNMRSMMTN